MPEHKAKIACLLSGNGTTMSALLFQSRLPDCPYEIVLVASNNPEAPGLKIAAAEGIATTVYERAGGVGGRLATTVLPERIAIDPDDDEEDDLGDGEDDDGEDEDEDDDADGAERPPGWSD